MEIMLFDSPLKCIKISKISQITLSSRDAINKTVHQKESQHFYYNFFFVCLFTSTVLLGYFCCFIFRNTDLKSTKSSECDLIMPFNLTYSRTRAVITFYRAVCRKQPRKRKRKGKGVMKRKLYR